MGDFEFLSARYLQLCNLLQIPAERLRHLLVYGYAGIPNIPTLPNYHLLRSYDRKYAILQLTENLVIKIPQGARNV